MGHHHGVMHASIYKPMYSDCVQWSISNNNIYGVMRAQPEEDHRTKKNFDSKFFLYFTILHPNIIDTKIIDHNFFEPFN